jgi:formate transporter
LKMEKTFLAPEETIDCIISNGEKKTKLSFLKTIILGFLAGVYIGFGAHLSTVATTGISDHLGFGLTKIIGGIVFSVGLMMVVIAGAELFTGNSLMIISLLNKKISIKGLLRNWTIVFIANFIGSIVLALMIYMSGVIGHGDSVTSVGKTAVSIAALKTELSFIQILIRGILANWLVCIAVFFATSAKDITGKILGCMFPIMAFVAMGFEHSIANMYFLSIGILSTINTPDSISFSSTAINIVAATIGNIIGGGFFVATLYFLVYKRTRE